MKPLIPGLVVAALAVLPCALAAQSASPTMKAIVVHAYGGVDVLKYEDAPRPEPKEDEILIRVMAAAVNPVDAAIRETRYCLSSSARTRRSIIRQRSSRTQ